MRELLLDFGISVQKVPIMEDNTACVQISKNPIHHQRTKHVAKYYMYLRDLCLAGEIELVGCGTKVQVAHQNGSPTDTRADGRWYLHMWVLSWHAGAVARHHVRWVH